MRIRLAGGCALIPGKVFRVIDDNGMCIGLAGGCGVQGASGTLDGLWRFCGVAQWLPGPAAHLRAGPSQGQLLPLRKHSPQADPMSFLNTWKKKWCSIVADATLVRVLITSQLH